MNTQTTEFKVLLIGDGGVGKTTYINRLLTGEFTQNYVATLGADVHQVSFHTTIFGKIVFNVWDCSGQEKFNSILSKYFIDADAVIIMFDNCSMLSYKSIPKWINIARQNNANIPIILCGNKVDIAERKVMPKIITAHKKYGLAAYYDISAKSCYNFERPFIKLARILKKNNSINFDAYVDE